MSQYFNIIYINYHNPYLHEGVALTPCIRSCPPNVFADFFYFPSNLLLYFSFIAVVFSSTLLFKYAYFTIFCYLIFYAF